MLFTQKMPEPVRKNQLAVSLELNDSALPTNSSEVASTKSELITNFIPGPIA